MENKSLSGTLSYTSITLLILAVLMFPIPGRFMDFVLLFNIVLSVLLLIDVRQRKTNNDYSIFSKYLYYMSIFGLAINMMVTRQIVTMGETFNSTILRSIASLLTEIRIEILIIVLILFLACTVYVFIKRLLKACNTISAAAGLNLDNRHKKITNIQTEYDIRSITEEEADKKKMIIQDEVNFFNALNNSAGFFCNCEKFRLALILVNSAGGIIFGTRFKGEPFSDAFEFYVSLTVSAGILALIPVFLIVISLEIVLLQKLKN